MYSESSNRERTKEKGYQEREKSQERDDLNDKECYYCKIKRHIQMMCKRMKADLKRMRSLRDGGRTKSENSGNVALNLVGNDDEDYDRALLVNGE